MDNMTQSPLSINENLPNPVFPSLDHVTSRREENAAAIMYRMGDGDDVGVVTHVWMIRDGR